MRFSKRGFVAVGVTCLSITAALSGCQRPGGRTAASPLPMPPVELIWSSTGENATFSRYGSALATGDVNNDGFADLLVGASGYADKDLSVGKPYLYMGGPRGPAQKPSWTSMGEHLPGSGYGLIVKGAGDLNHDHYDDILVAAPRLTGKVFLYPGSSRGPSEWPVWSSSGNDQGGSRSTSTQIAFAIWRSTLTFRTPPAIPMPERYSSFSGRPSGCRRGRPGPPPATI